VIGSLGDARYEIGRRGIRWFWWAEVPVPGSRFNAHLGMKGSTWTRLGARRKVVSAAALLVSLPQVGVA
jgi:hypothetical protein